MRSAGPGGAHEHTLLMVFGDHGQTLTGDHGGGAPEEVESALFALHMGAYHHIRSKLAIRHHTCLPLLHTNGFGQIQVHLASREQQYMQIFELKSRSASDISYMLMTST